jgi:protein phosphatase
MSQPSNPETTEVDLPLDYIPLEAPVPFSSRVRIGFGAVSHVGKVRQTNQDAYLIYRTGRYWEKILTSLAEGDLPDRYEETGYVMAVADGMGGAAGGEVASRLALCTGVNLVLNAVKWALKLDHPAEREAEIREGQERAVNYFRQIDAALTRRAAEDPALAGMGTTLTVASSVGDDLLVYHVGDSRAYLFRRGKLQRLTRDHTLAQALADAGAIDPEDVPAHRLHHVLTRTMGGHGGQVETDFHHYQLADGDRVLLCTDGLTGMVPDEQIGEVLRATETSAEGCQALLERALEGGGTDNVTIILARYDIPPRAAAV